MKTRPDSGVLGNDSAPGLGVLVQLASTSKPGRIPDVAGSTPAPATTLCKRCHRALNPRYAFTICVKCSLERLAEDLNADGYYERMTSRRERNAEIIDRARLVAKGLIEES